MSGGDEATGGGLGSRRRSWRSTRLREIREAGGGGGTPASQAPRTSPESPAAPQRRRRRAGGEPSSRSLRLFFPLAGLGVLLGLIALVVWQLVDFQGPRTRTFIALTVTNYAAPVPPNDFADADAVMLGVSVDARSFDVRPTENKQTTERFRQFFERDLAAAVSEGTDTLVLYLSVHGVGDDQRAFLLTDEADADGSKGWIPLAAVLQAVSRLPAAHKLLLLDAHRIGPHFDLGLPRNAFADRLVEECERLPKDQNLWVVAAASPGQTATVEPALGRSYFALAAAHALAGGSDVDRGEGDREISASELVAFLTDFLAGKIPGGYQTPHLQKVGRGEDFSLSRVRVGSTIEGFLSSIAAARSAQDEAAAAEGAPASEESEKSAEPPKDAVVAKSAATQDPAETKADANAKKPFTERLLAAWAERDRLAKEKAAAVLDGIDVWTSFERALLAAETWHLAGEPARAEAILKNRMPPLLERVEKLSAWPAGETWSAGLAAEPPAKDSIAELLIKVVADPKPFVTSGDETARRIREAPVVEAEILTRLAGDPFLEPWIVDGKWRRPELIQQWFDTRRAAEKAAAVAIQCPEDSVAKKLFEADQTRRRAESSLFLPRPDRAAPLLTQTSGQFRDVARAAENWQQKSREVDRSLAEAGDYLRWIGAIPASRRDRAQRVERFGYFLDAVAEFARAPNLGNLELAAAAAASLEEQARLYSPESRAEARAALLYPAHPVAVRTKLLAAVADPALPEYRLTFVDRPGENPFPVEPLRRLLEALAGGSAASGATPKNAFEAVASLRKRLLDDRGEAEALKDPFRRRLFELLQVSFRTAPSGSGSEEKSPNASVLRKRIEERLRKDDESLPGPPSFHAKSRKSLDPAAIVERPFPAFERSSEPAWLVDGSSQDFTFRLRPTRAISDREGSIELAWDDSLVRLVPSGARPIGEFGAAERSFPIPVGDEEIVFPMSIAAREGFRPTEAVARLVRSDSATEWFRVRLDPKSAPKRIAELDLAADPSIQVYPNETVPLAIRLSRAPDAPELRVEFRCENELREIVIPPATKDSKPIVVADAQMRMPIGGRKLQVRVLGPSDEVLDERSLDVVLHHPVEIVRPEARIVRGEGGIRFEATVRPRLSLNRPLRLALTVLDASGGLVGKVEGSLKTTDAAAPLEVVLPKLDRSRPPIALLDVNGFERAFRYRLDRPAGAVGADESLAIRIASPRPRTVYLVDRERKTIEAEVEVDVPPPVLSDLGDADSRNRGLAMLEAGLVPWSTKGPSAAFRRRAADRTLLVGKEIALSLVGTAKGLAIESKVADPVVSIDVESIQPGPFFLSARIDRDGEKREAAVPVAFVAPRGAGDLKILSPSIREKVGAPGVLAVEAGAAPGMGPFFAAIRGGVDLDGRLGVTEDENLVPDPAAVRFGEDDRAVVRLPLGEKLPAGPTRIGIVGEFRALDPKGNEQSIERSAFVEVQLAAAEPTPEFGDVLVRVVLEDGSDVSNADIVLKDAKGAEHRRAAGEELLFKGLPAGPVEIKASSSKREGKATGKVVAGEKTTIPVAIRYVLDPASP